MNTLMAIEAFSNVRVLCIGDVMVDRYVTGTVARISPERPVPVFSSAVFRDVPGGAANVARNIAALGGSATLLGLVGDDDAGQRLAHALAQTPRIRNALVQSPGRPTTEKTRFVCQGQHVLRVDHEDSGPLSPAQSAALLERIAALVAEHNVLVLSDYNKGVLSDRVISTAVALARQRQLPVVVDPKSENLARYAGATVITPNARETYDATRIQAKDDDRLAEQAGRKILAEAGVASVLITRSEKGMSLIMGDRPPLHIPSLAREVFDVVGAGDTVVATLAVAMGSGLDLGEAARLANVAAGIAVAKRDTATVSASELMDALARQPTDEQQQLGGKIMTSGELAFRLAMWRQDGLQVGFTNGCFDLLHLGHLRVINFAKAHCDRLIVALNSDSSIRRLKGENRPVKAQPDRALIIAALAAVDAVVIFDEDTPLDLIRRVQPDVLVKGADHAPSEIVGAAEVLAGGGRVLTCELLPGKGTAELIAQLGQG